MPDCTNCAHYRKSGNYATCECESEDCEWELKKPTLAEAMKIAELLHPDVIHKQWEDYIKEIML